MFGLPTSPEEAEQSGGNEQQEEQQQQYDPQPTPAANGAALKEKWCASPEADPGGLSRSAY